MHVLQETIHFSSFAGKWSIINECERLLPVAKTGLQGVRVKYLASYISCHPISTRHEGVDYREHDPTDLFHFDLCGADDCYYVFQGRMVVKR